MKIIFFVFYISAVVSLSIPTFPKGGPPIIQGIQGNDDEEIPLDLLQNPSALQARYDNLALLLSPGNRRYNMFWVSFEDAQPPSTSPITCDSNHILIPSNETDRLQRGYHHYHCYNLKQLLSFDQIFAQDARIGSVSTAIVYGTPDFAINPACTGFPWPPNPNFKLGCIPWNNFDDWEDYINLLIERWRAPIGSGQARLSGLCIWNEIQSMGWSDPSPILSNRWNGTPWTSSQMDIYTGAIAQLFIRASVAAVRQSLDSEGIMLWLSTDHFTTAPKLNIGDVGHVGLYDFLDSFWPKVANETFSWGVCVHPYDNGDPRSDLSSQGIYTFVNLRDLVGKYQCKKLNEVLNVPLANCWEWPQTQLWASEQGWPISRDVNKSIQARNICLAHGLSLSQGLWSVSHNTFQTTESSSQGGSGDFSLIDEPPKCLATLSNCTGLETFDAYVATAPGVFGITSNHYCCINWKVGCEGGV
jgi:hypothetical protein